MAVGPNLVRRGAVYHWRRRIPSRLVPFVGASHLRLSLNTKDSSQARRLGAQLDATAMEIFSSRLTERMTRDQLAELFKATHLQHKAKLELAADIERMNTVFSRPEHLAMELAHGEAYGLFSRQGANAFLGPEDEKRLRDKGYDTEGIKRIIEQLEALRLQGGIKFSEAKLAHQIEATGAMPNAVNLATALPVYLRALSEALLTAEQRFGVQSREPLDYSALLKEFAAQAAPHFVQALSHDVPAPAGIDAIPPPAPSMTVVAEPSAEPAMPTIDARVIVIGEKLIAKKVSGKSNAELRAEPGKANEARARASGWDDKTVRQARGIYELFNRFLLETYGFNDLGRVRQTHLAAFEEFLRELHPSFGRSPKDKVRTIAELRVISAQKGPQEGTLMPGTLNRHLTNLGQLLKHARAVGVRMDAGLSTSELRSEPTGRGRDQRPVPAQGTVEKLMSEPAFTGCAGWDRPAAPGPLIFHRALYFGTLIALLMGLRREEFCGLAPEDIVDDAPHPYIIVRFTDHRRLKNVQSKRFLAIHPEIIRLGFLDYVRVMRSLNHTRLFEELYSSTTKSPMGDRYYDELKPSLVRCGVTPHQLRHFFNNALKQRKISKEFRADLLGHGGESETDERYVDPVELNLQLEILAHLPSLTAHLEPSPIQLVPWVERHETAPWSRASRSVARQEAEYVR